MPLRRACYTWRPTRMTQLYSFYTPHGLVFAADRPLASVA
jgi:hypothetical protein